MIRAIAAIDKNRGLGAKNDLLFNIKADMLHFRNYTAKGIVVVGYNTLLSFPNQKPLPGRTTICLCPPEINRTDCFCVHTFDECLALVKELAKTQDVWIIGGGMLYTSMLPYCDNLELTHIDADGNAEVFFPDYTQDFEPSAVDVWETENGIRYRFVSYRRK